MITEATLIRNHSLTSSLLHYRNDTDTVNNIIECVASPIIIGVGLTGNVVGSASLLRVAGLRSRGIGHLLVAICVSDVIFLVSLLPMWFGRRYGRQYDLYNSDGWCELLTLTTMSSNFLSTWFTAALGIERYVAVRHSRRNAPHVNGRENLKPTTRGPCGPTRTRVAIIALTILAIVVFVNMVVNIGVVNGDDGLPHCTPLLPAVDAWRILSNLDLVVNVITPDLITTGLYTVIGARLAVLSCRRSRAISRHAPPSLPRFSREDDGAVCPAEIRLTRSAVLLSAVVVLLSAPSHAVRVIHFVAEVFRLPVLAWIGGSTVQLVVRELFYASFAVPFFVVVASHYRIRRSIVLSVKLALESTWKRLQVACCSCVWQDAHITAPQSAEHRPHSTVITPHNNG